MRDRSNTTGQRSTPLGHRLIAAAATAACLTVRSAAAADDAAAQAYHTALTNHVPGFITAPGQTDYLFVIVVVLLLVIVLIIGNLYFQLHAVPERIAHRANKGQMEIVAVLALISLFTHNHIYWIIGLLLALIRIPDFSTPIYSIARSMARLASRDPEAANLAPAPGAPAAQTPAPHAAVANAPAAAPPSAPARITPEPAAAPVVAASPVTGAPISPLPVAATHAHPPGQTNARPAPQAAEATNRTDPHGEGI